MNATLSIIILLWLTKKEAFLTQKREKQREKQSDNDTLCENRPINLQVTD